MSEDNEEIDEILGHLSSASQHLRNAKEKETLTDIVGEDGNPMTIIKFAKKMNISEENARELMIIRNTSSYLLGLISGQFGLAWDIENAPEPFLEFLAELIKVTPGTKSIGPHVNIDHDTVETAYREAEAYIKNPELRKAEGVVKILASEFPKKNRLMLIQNRDKSIQEESGISMEVQKLLKGRPKAYFYYRFTKAKKMEFIQEAHARIW